jgi:hypothetical protein
MVLCLSFSDSTDTLLPLPSTEIVPAVIYYLPVSLAWSLLYRTLTFFMGICLIMVYRTVEMYLVLY